jgi:uncharacterized protein YecT (DUF1311 family)
MDDRDPVVEDAASQRRPFNKWLIIALVVAVLAGVVLASTLLDNRWSGGDEKSDSASEAKGPDMEKWCAAQASYDAMKRELFRRAAQVRGDDEAAYARLADFALLRVNGPVARGIDDRLHSVSCSGTAVLSLPPGVAVAGGRRSLSGDVDYTIEPAADGTGNVVRLGNSDAIVIPLATLSRVAAPAPAPAPAQTDNAVTGEQPMPDASQSPGQPQAIPQRASPSFNCANARTRGEIAVCNDSGLAALDRQMAAQYNAAISEADASQRRLLERTRNRFLTYRDRCTTNECVANTYRGRIQEIRDIAADRWRG